MLPRILSAQFGLLDDGISLFLGQKLPEDPLAPFTFMRYSGRFFPIFWLYQSLLFQVAKFTPQRWFLANTVLLIVLSILLYLIALRLTRNKWSAWLASVFFILSGPVVESFYTISKSEPLMLLFVSLAVLLSFFFLKPISPAKKLGVFISLTLLLSCAYASKETAIVLIGISAGWLVLALIFNRKSKNPPQVQMAAWLLAASLTAAALYFGVRAIFHTVPLAEGGYSSLYRLEIESITDQLLRWLGRFIRDDFYILPLAFMLALPAVRRRINGGLTFFIGAWLAAWFVVLLPWRVLESYYTLPFAYGIALLAGTMTGNLLQALPEISGKIQRGIAWTFGCATILAFLILEINNYTNAGLQLMYDRTNAQMVEILSKLPGDATVLFNVPEPLEYVNETKLHLSSLYRRNDIIVDYLAYEPKFAANAQDYYIVSPVFYNQFLPAVRNSLHEGGAREWEGCLNAYIGSQSGIVLVGSSDDEFLGIDIGLNRLLPSIGIDDPLSYGLRPWIERKRTIYGWRIYQLPERSEAAVAPGIYEDGLWRLGWPEEQSRQVAFGTEGDVPLTGDWNGDGLTDLGLFRATSNLWLFDVDRDGLDDLSDRINRLADGSIPVSGDWNGDGVDTPGWYDPETQTWFLGDSSFNASPNWSEIHFGAEGSQPLVGDWDGDGLDTPAIVDPETSEFQYIDNLAAEPGGATTFKLPAGRNWVAAKWFSDKMDTLAVISDSGEWIFIPINQDCHPSNPYFRMESLQQGGYALAGVWGNAIQK